MIFQKIKTGRYVRIGEWFLVVLLVIPIALSSVFCCCLHHVFSSFSGEKSSSSHCHSPASAPSSSGQDHKCSCQKIIGSEGQKSTVRMELLENGFSKFRTSDSHVPENIAKIRTAFFMDTAPPGGAYPEIPRFLKILNIRI